MSPICRLWVFFICHSKNWFHNQALSHWESCQRNISAFITITYFIKVAWQLRKQQTESNHTTGQHNAARHLHHIWLPVHVLTAHSLLSSLFMTWESSRRWIKSLGFWIAQKTRKELQSPASDWISLHTIPNGHYKHLESQQQMGDLCVPLPLSVTLTLQVK